MFEDAIKHALNGSVFDRLIDAVENGEVIALKQDGETIAVMIQPELLAELREEILANAHVVVMTECRPTQSN